MFARVTTFSGYVQDLDHAVVVAREQIVPRLEQHHGFEGVMLMVDPAAEIGLAISLWTDEEDLGDSDTEERQLMKGAARAFEVTADIRHCEVLYSTWSGPEAASA
jgi:hypothetical protein